MRSKWDFGVVHKIRRTIKKLGKGLIVHCHGVRGGWLGRLACIGPRNRAPRVVYSEHLWTSEYRLRNPISSWVQLSGLWFLDLFTDVTIAVSADVANFITRRGITRPNKVVVIYNGIELNEHKKSQRLIANDKRQIRIGFVGSLVDRKGIEYLIRAMSELNLRYKIPNLKLVIVGEGEKKENLKDLAKNLNLKKQIEFKGLVKKTDAIYPTLDIYVQPSIDESFGIAALEAMNWGLPVVATQVGGLKEILNKKESVSDKPKAKFLKTDCGILVPPKNSSALAAAIYKLIKNPKLAKKLGNGAKKRASFFSAAVMAKNIEKIYQVIGY